MASAGKDGRIKVWDLSRSFSQAPEPAFELRGTDRYAYRLRFTEDPFGLLSMHGDSEVRWWELDAERDERRCFNPDEARAVIDVCGPHFSIVSVAIDPSGRLVAWGGGALGQGILKVETFPEGRSVPTELSVRALPNLIGNVEFSADGHRLAVSDNRGGIWLLDSHEGRVLAEGRHTSRLSAPCFLSPSGDRLLTGSLSGELLVWSDTGQGTLRSRSFAAHTERVSDIALSADRRWIASTSPWSSELLVRPWLADEAAPGEIVRSYHQQDVRAPLFLTSGQLVAAAGEHLVVVDPADPGATPRRFGTGRHRANIFALDFSSRTGLMASGGQDGAVLLWKVLPDGEIELLRTLRTAKPGNDCYHLSFSPDGRFLAAALERGTESVVWDLKYYEKHVAGNLAGVLDAQQRAGEGPPPEVARRIKQWIQETWRR
ncbi:MAG: WD40 repeat domain-containing protein [Planctomycetota bacterium]